MNVYGARIRESRIPLLCSSGSLRRSVGESPYLVVQRYTHTHRHAYTSPSSTRISCRANGGRPFVTAEGVYRRQDDPASDTHSLRRIVGRTCSTRACVPEAREPRVCARTYPSPSSPTLPPAPARATYSRIYEYQRGPSSAYTLIYPRTHSRFQLLLSLSLSLSFSLLHSVTLLPPAGPRLAYRVSSAASHGHRQTRHGSRSRSGACGFHGETRRSVRWLADNSGERSETGWIRGGFVAIQGTRFQHRQTAVPRTARAASSPCHRRRSTPSPALREQHPGGNARSRARRTICQVSKSEAHISSTATRSRVFPLTRGSQRR